MPIGKIVGTVEPTSCSDRHFRPTSEVPRTRFERIAGDILSGRGMDPVDLYRCGGQYYVLDGRHRIAVARARRALGPGEHHRRPPNPSGHCQRPTVRRTLRIQACPYGDVATIAESGAA